MIKENRILAFLFLFLIFRLFCLADIDTANLIKKIDSSVDDERYTVISYLGNIKCREAREPLEKRLQESGFYEKDIIISALIKIGNPLSVVSILRKEFSERYFNAKDVEKILNRLSPGWRKFPEINGFIEEIIKADRSQKNNEQENKEEVLKKIAFLNNKKDWHIEVEVIKDSQSLEPGNPKFHLNFKLRRIAEKESLISIPFYFKEYYYLSSYTEQLNLLEEGWQNKFDFTPLKEEIKIYTKQVLVELKEINGLKEKESLLSDKLHLVMAIIYELKPAYLYVFLNNILGNQENELFVRAYCLIEQLYSSKKAPIPICFDFIAEIEKSNPIGKYSLLSRILNYFAREKNKRIIPYILKKLDNYNKSAAEDELDFYKYCLVVLNEIDKKKAEDFAVTHLARLHDEEEPSAFDVKCTSILTSQDKKKLKNSYLKKILLTKKEPRELFWAIKESNKKDMLPVLIDYIAAHDDYSYEALNSLERIITKDDIGYLYDLCDKLLKNKSADTVERLRGTMRLLVKLNDNNSADFICEWLQNFDSRFAIKIPEPKNSEEEELENYESRLESDRSWKDYLKKIMIKALADWKIVKAKKVIEPFLEDQNLSVHAYAEWALWELER